VSAVVDFVYFGEDFGVCGDGGRGEEESARGHGGGCCCAKGRGLVCTVFGGLLKVRRVVYWCAMIDML
jgi:hypothetical protein